jgi:hypothetical protein
MREVYMDNKNIKTPDFRTSFSCRTLVVSKLVDFKLSHWTSNSDKLLVTSQVKDKISGQETILACISLRTRKTNKEEGKLDLWCATSDAFIEIKMSILETAIELARKNKLSSVTIKIKDSNDDDIQILKEAKFELVEEKPVRNFFPGLHICHEVKSCKFRKII